MVNTEIKVITFFLANNGEAISVSKNKTRS